MTKALFAYKYAALLCVRAAFVVSPGYIHPDEFFQSGEVMASHVFGSAIIADLPWEYASSQPFRSYAPIACTSGIAFKIVRKLAGSKASGWARLVAPRLFMLGLSAASDAITYKLSKHLNGDTAAKAATLLRASSWIAVVLSTRTFSNALELFCLDVLFAACIFLKCTKKWISIGTIVAAGCFVRITFPAFAASIVALALIRDKKWRSFGLFCISGIVVAAAIIAFDCWWHRVHVDRSAPLSIVPAPVRNLAYNLDVDNLATHGLHPRLTHVAVNCQLLFGPVFAAVAASILRARVSKMLAASIFVPLCVLSIFPHQEPRFLAPLLLPFLSLLAGCIVDQTLSKKRGRAGASRWLRALSFLGLRTKAASSDLHSPSQRCCALSKAATQRWSSRRGTHIPFRFIF